jgi:hypothetical protein
MRRTFLSIFAATLSLVLAFAAVDASSVHLKGGANAEPSFRDNGLSLRASGALSGLGGGDVMVSLTAEADVISTCTNQGGNAAPGQNPAPITVMGGQAIPEPELKNGTTPFNVLTEEPNPVIAGAPDCANTNWTESIDDLSFTSAVIVVEQPVGTTVLTITCDFDPPTDDGAVRAADVSCTSS